MKIGNLLKVALLLSIVLTSLYELNAQPNSLKEMKLRGKVKKVVANEYPIDDTAANKKRKMEYTFDLKGNKLSEIIYNESGNWLYKAKMEYNKAGNLLTESSSNKITFHVNMTKRYIYDKNNRLVTTKLFNRYKHLISIVSYTYNGKGQLTLVVNVNDVGTELERTAYRYDAYNRLEEEQVLDSKSALVSYSRYEYDAQGRKISKADYDKDGFKDFISEYTYDQYGNLKSELSNYTGGLSTLIEYHYRYDKNHNWISMREQMNGRTFAVTEREIELWK